MGGLRCSSSEPSAARRRPAATVETHPKQFFNARAVGPHGFCVKALSVVHLRTHKGADHTRQRQRLAAVWQAAARPGDGPRAQSARPAGTPHFGPGRTPNRRRAHPRAPLKPHLVDANRDSQQADARAAGGQQVRQVDRPDGARGAQLRGTGVVARGQP